MSYRLRCGLSTWSRSGFVPAALAVALAVAPARAQVVYGWLGTNGGFRDPTKWWPNGVPSTADWASFALVVPSTVSFDSDVSNAVLNVAAGDVTFELAGHTYSLTNPSSTAYPYSVNVGTVEAWTGELTLRGGTLNGATSVLGVVYGTAGLVTVDTGATWHNSGILCVAFGGAGTLTVQNGGQLHCAGGTLGMLLGSVAAATVTGADSTWTTGLLHVGELGKATLTIQNGAAVQTAGYAALGHSLTGDGAVTVTGAGSTWEASSLYVGGTHEVISGLGALTVSNGGTVDVGGTVKVWRTVALQDGGLLVANQVWRGPAGTLTAAAGSTLRVNELVGFGATPSFGGGLDMGHAGGPGSSSYAVAAGQALSVGDALTIGYDGYGMLTISGGGAVTSGSGMLGRSADSHGAATVMGLGSSWTISGGLFLGGSEALPGGSGDLKVSAEGVLAAGGALKLWPEGKLTITDGGHVTAGSFENAGGALTWRSGSLRLLDDLTVDSNDPFGVGEELRLGAERTLGVSGTLTLDGPGTVWLVDGGRLECGAVDSVDGGMLRWDGGTLAFPAGACVSSDDPFCAVGGSAVTPGRTLEVAGLLEVAVGGVLTLDGGVIRADRMTRAGGELAFHRGTCEIRERLDMGDEACVLGGGADDQVSVIVGGGPYWPPVVAFRDLTLARGVEMVAEEDLDGNGAPGSDEGGAGGAGGKLTVSGGKLTGWTIGLAGGDAGGVGSGGAGGAVSVSGGELSVSGSLNARGGESGPDVSGGWGATGGPGGAVNVSGGSVMLGGAFNARGGSGARGDYGADGPGGPGGDGGGLVVSGGLADLYGDGDVGGGAGGRYGGDGGRGGTLTVTGGAVWLGGTWSVRGGAAGEDPWLGMDFWSAGGGPGGRVHVAGGEVAVGGTLDARGGSGGPCYIAHGYPFPVSGGGGGPGGGLDVSGGRVVLIGTVDLRGGAGGQGNEAYGDKPAGEGGPGGPGGRIRLWGGELVLQPGCRIDLAGGAGGPGGWGDPRGPTGSPGAPGAFEMSGGTLTVDASAFDAMLVAGSLNYTGGSFHLTGPGGFAIGQSTGQIAEALGGSHVRRSAGNDLTVDAWLTVAAGATLQVDGGCVTAEWLTVAPGATLQVDGGCVTAGVNGGVDVSGHAGFAFTGGELRVLCFGGKLINDGGAIRLPLQHAYPVPGRSMWLEGDLVMNAGSVETWVIPVCEQPGDSSPPVAVERDVALGGTLELSWLQVHAPGLPTRQPFGGPYDVLIYREERSGEFTSFAEPGTTGEWVLDSGETVLSSTIGERYVAGIDYDADAKSQYDWWPHAVRVELYDLLEGDCNVDGEVNRGDFVALREGFGSPNANWSCGDVTFDGCVDYLDYVALKRNCGRCVPDAAAIPEPATLLLLVGAGAAILRKRRPR